MKRRICALPGCKVDISHKRIDAVTCSATCQSQLRTLKRQMARDAKAGNCKFCQKSLAGYRAGATMCDLKACRSSRDRRNSAIWRSKNPERAIFLHRRWLSTPENAARKKQADAKYGRANRQTITSKTALWRLNNPKQAQIIRDREKARRKQELLELRALKAALPQLLLEAATKGL